MPNEMYEEYVKAYKTHSSTHGPDTAIFYQVGKFYEFYDWIDPINSSTHTSMKRFVDILGVRLSVKKGDGPNKSDALFAGVPEQSLHKYAATLSRAGWVVVVYDQVKDAKGAVTSRDVVRILTPGTHVEALSSVTEGGATYFAGVWIEDSVWGSKDPFRFSCLCVDLTTGRCITHEGIAAGKRGSWTTDDVCHFFQVYLPTECVVWWRGDPLDQPAPEELQRKFGIPGSRIQFVSATDQGGFERPMVREEFLERVFAIQSLLPTREVLQLSQRPLTERLLCAAFQRLQEYYPTGFKRIHVPEQWSPSANLSLGNQALFQLNIVTPKMEDSILGLFQRTHTVFGKRAMRNRILYPTANVQSLKLRYTEIAYVLSMGAEMREEMHRNLRQIEDLPRIHRRMSEGDTTPSEVLLLDTSYICAQRLLDLLKGTPLEPLSPIDVRSLQKEFYSVFSVEKAAVANENAFCFENEPEVARIEGDIALLYRDLDTVVQKVSKWSRTDGLKLEFREVLAPILVGNKATMAAVATALRSTVVAPYERIYVHAKKSSAHVEIPVLEDIYQRILMERSKLQAAVKRVLPVASGKLATACTAIWNSVESWIANVDVTNTIATVSRERGFSCPRIDEAVSESYVRMENLRHPLIEASLKRTEYVKHSVDLGSGSAPASANGWLIYGMNASGKSSLMKAVGIALILAQSGCYVPATNFHFHPFRTLFTRILNTDNLWAGLSSFAVEMTELREILQRADTHSLVLGDEVCSGTESVSAAAIVGASLQWLKRRGAKFIFATHLHGLDSVVGEDGIAIWHLKVRYEPLEDRLIYDRTLTPGSGSSLYGLEVARAMNLPEEVLAVAHTLRRQITGTRTELDAPSSVWNSEIQRRVCEVCGEAFVKDLEVHHIRPRREAGTETFSDGDAVNHVRNLITVCSACHDAHHAGILEISPLIQTSEGAKRLTGTSEGSRESVRRSKWSEEQTQQIRNYLRMYPSVPPKRAVFDLQELGITISVSGLRSFRGET